jgi:ATP-dependent DNA helicase MPH1
MIDEAHRATGSYAYVTIVHYLMAHNPHHRILALSATPGKNSESVQAIVDGLHISRIEIRDEHSMDLQKYMFKKVSGLYATRFEPLTTTPPSIQTFKS